MSISSSPEVTTLKISGNSSSQSQETSLSIQSDSKVLRIESTGNKTQPKVLKSGQQIQSLKKQIIDVQIQQSKPTMGDNEINEVPQLIPTKAEDEDPNYN